VFAGPCLEAAEASIAGDQRRSISEDDLANGERHSLPNLHIRSEGERLRQESLFSRERRDGPGRGLHSYTSQLNLSRF
jgi:hypothetical protein